MTRPRRPAHRVELRVTDTAGKELHQNLVRRRIRDLDCIHHERFVRFNQDRRSGFSAHGWGCWSIGMLGSDPSFHHSITPLLQRITSARYRRAAVGGTDTPRTPAFSIARATSPEAFTSSMNSRRYVAPWSRPLGIPSAC